MERINYNRGGSGGAYNRGGGRNNGGRGSWGAQGGGRGDGGRGNNGGYYPRGGRNRNYQQRYSNQQQQQYGGGRGRGYGGPRGGRGQQTYRTPAYPRQNADLVPDRFGGDREVRTWTPVPSGQPVHQHPVAHHQVQEVPRPDVRSESSPRGVEHSKDDAENTYLRPDRGTLASYSVKLLICGTLSSYSVKLLVNHFRSVCSLRWCRSAYTQVKHPFPIYAFGGVCA